MSSFKDHSVLLQPGSHFCSFGRHSSGNIVLTKAKRSWWHEIWEIMYLIYEIMNFWCPEISFISQGMCNIVQIFLFCCYLLFYFIIIVYFCCRRSINYQLWCTSVRTVVLVYTQIKLIAVLVAIKYIYSNKHDLKNVQSVNQFVNCEHYFRDVTPESSNMTACFKMMLEITLQCHLQDTEVKWCRGKSEESPHVEEVGMDAWVKQTQDLGAHCLN